jgi:hypothetical protein
MMSKELFNANDPNEADRIPKIGGARALVQKTSAAAPSGSAVMN